MNGENIPVPSFQPHNFNSNYEELLAGVNRIRYLKKKQKKNHLLMNQHFSHLLQKLQLQQQHQKFRNKNNIILPRTQSQQPGKFQQAKYIFSENSPYKPKHKLLPSHSQQISGFLSSIEQDCGDSFSNKISQIGSGNKKGNEVRSESRRQKMKIILKQRQQNYQLMRQMRSKIEQQKVSRKMDELRFAKEIKQRVEFSRQQGRKKMEEHYFKHLEAIKAEKQIKKARKIRAEEERYQQVLELQRKQQQQLQLFERSILVEEELKSYIEQISGIGKEIKQTEDTTLI